MLVIRIIVFSLKKHAKNLGLGEEGKKKYRFSISLVKDENVIENKYIYICLCLMNK